MSIQFRTQVLSTDIDDIKEIVLSSGFFYPYEIPVPLKLVHDVLEYNNQDPGYSFVFACDENKVVGFICYGENPCTLGSYDVLWIAVHNDFRFKGIGKDLLNKMHIHIEQLKARMVIAETSGIEKYEPTRRFYESNGYTLEAQIRDFYQPGDDKLIFVKRWL